MESSGDKHWASKYLLDPLNEPEPSAETGPGSHFSSTLAPAETPESTTKNASSTVSEVGSYPTPPHSASPTRTRFSKAREDGASAVQAEDAGHRRRGSSLHERYPGDDSNRPLDIIRKSSLRAHRSPHLRKDHHHGVDSIDKLAGEMDAFHVGGPFDAVSQARNISSRDSPVAALRSSNAEALRATPREAIIDSLRHHRPLDGVASFPPGVPDRAGKVLRYREGENIQRGTGDNVLRQWPALVDYHPDDIKGKGEPSFTIERALQKNRGHQRATSESIEMMSNHRSSLGDNNPFAPRARASSGAATSGREQPYTEWESNLSRSKSAKGSLSRKLGSLRRRHRGEANA